MFHIALCDDNVADLDRLASILKDLDGCGLPVRIARYENGPDLLADFSQGILFHLLVIDMLMEPLNGIDTAREIRRSDLSMPILIVTSTTRFALEGYQVNAWRYLTKPVDPGALLAEARSILERERSWGGVRISRSVARANSRRCDSMRSSTSNRSGIPSPCIPWTTDTSSAARFAISRAA